jgi:hypothetical protein
MSKNSKIEVKGFEISIFQLNNADYISLTDIARHKDQTNNDDIIRKLHRFALN